MVRFKYRFCKVHMARFVNGDLADHVRRRVARYIDECDDCYREYLQHREFAHKLERSLPTLGHAHPAKLDKIWTSLQADLLETQASPHWFGDFRSRPGSNFSYGLVIVAITIALLLPMMIGFHTTLLTVELPHMPQYASIVRTPASQSSQKSFISATTRSNARRQSPLLQNTPSPRF